MTTIAAPLLYALLLLLAAAALLVLEMLLVSFGLLSVAALACALGAVYYAFQLGQAAGYGFVAAIVLITPLLLRWGLRRMRASKAVAHAEIAGDAGYRQVAERLGIAAGSVGVLVTPAHPTGRARFAGGECDVQARNRALARGARVTVTHISGPTVYVTALPDEAGDAGAGAASDEPRIR